MSDLVKLISLTPEAEKTILYCARVSSNQENEDVGLIRYLIKHKHWSPFELAHATIEFNTSRALGPEFLRHKSFAFQEFSQRYATVQGTVKYHGRRQAETNRQSSTDDMSVADQNWFQRAQLAVERHNMSLYHEALERGFARECARFLLPISASTKIYMSGSIRSWIHFFEVRCHMDAQLEMQILAYQARDLLAPQLPTIAEALWSEDD